MSSKTVDGIVRGPRPYFGADGKIYAPGQIVANLSPDEVSTKDFVEEEVEVEARNGDLRKRTIQRRVKFRPVGDAPTIAGPGGADEVATGQPDRLNVTDFLKGGTDDIVAAIATGKVDDHLGVIEQQEISRKGATRKAITEAIAARLAATSR